MLAINRGRHINSQRSCSQDFINSEVMHRHTGRSSIFKWQKLASILITMNLTQSLAFDTFGVGDRQCDCNKLGWLFIQICCNFCYNVFPLGIFLLLKMSEQKMQKNFEIVENMKVTHSIFIFHLQVHQLKCCVWIPQREVGDL